MFRQKVKIYSLFTDKLFTAKVVKFQRKIRSYTPETHPIGIGLPAPVAYIETFYG